MGVAVGPQRIAVGTRRQVFVLHPAHDLAASLEPQGTYDACWLTRSSLVTGNVHGHEMAWGADGLWLVNTLFSCLCTLDEAYSFVPRWRPPFIAELAGQDRCHLNGLAMQDGRPRFVTAHAESNEPAGWRPNKATSGCVIDVPTGETVARGLCMPHSPRWYRGPALGAGLGHGPAGADRSAERPGPRPWSSFPATRAGMAICGQFAFVGLSKIRETSVFGGIPIAERRDELRCGVAAVDLLSGRAVAWLQFHSGVEEVFAVSVLPGCRNPVFSGPSAEEDDRQDIWVVPPEGRASAAPPPGGGRLRCWAHRFGRWRRPPLTVNPAAAGHAPIGRRSLGAAPAGAAGRGAAAVEARRRGRARPGRSAQRLGQPLSRPGRSGCGHGLLSPGGPGAARLASPPIRTSVTCSSITASRTRHLAHYEQALPSDALADEPPARRPPCLPVVYDSADEIERWRRRFTASVSAALADEGVRIDTTADAVPTDFFLAYQGENDRDLVRKLGRHLTRGRGPVRAPERRTSPRSGA